MPLARIRTDARELALDLAEELYELGYTVETISPSEYRDKAADLEIQLQPCEPDELISVVARAGDEYQKVYLAEGVIDRLPLYIEEPRPAQRQVPVESAPATPPRPVPVESAPAAPPPVPVDPAPVVPQPIAFVEIAVPPESPVIAAEDAAPAQPVAVPEPVEPPVEEVPVLAAATSDPYAQQSSGRTRRVAELVAGAGAALGRVGLFVSDQIDDCRERLSTLRTEVSQRMQARSERLQVERQRKAEIAAAEAVRREAESQRRREEAAALARAKQEAEALERSRQETKAPEPQIVQPKPAKRVAPVTQPVQVARRRPSPFQRAFNQPFRNPSGFALKLGTAVGLLGMIVVIGYANRRPATPVGLGELTRSTTVKQAAPFGAAEVKAAADTSLAPIPTSSASAASEKKAPEVKPAPKTRKATNDEFDGEPEVIVRHYAAQPKPAPKPVKDDGIKRFSDLD